MYRGITWLPPSCPASVQDRASLGVFFQPSAAAAPQIRGSLARPDATRDQVTTVPRICSQRVGTLLHHGLEAHPRAIRCARPRSACAKRGPALLWTGVRFQPGTRAATESDAGGAEHTSRVQFMPRRPDAVQWLGGQARAGGAQPGRLPGEFPVHSAPPASPPGVVHERGRPRYLRQTQSIDHWHGADEATSAVSDPLAP